MTAEEEGLLLSLWHRGHVHRITRLCTHCRIGNCSAMNEQFPILKCVYIGSCIQDDRNLVLPGTLQVPHLRHLRLDRSPPPPNRISNTYHSWPCRSRACRYPDIPLLPTRLSAHTALAHLPVGVALDWISHPSL
jgi:hypothetical protein